MANEVDSEDADGGVPMELEEPLNSSVQSLDEPSYIGDNCLSTPVSISTVFIYTHLC
mgnify:CR=1 FL=1